MLIGARNTMFSRRSGPPSLPYDAEVEYLESTGTQMDGSYVDTGVLADNDTGLIFEMSNLQILGPDFNFIGCRTDDQRFMVNYYRDTITFGFSGWINTGWEFQYTDKHVVSLNFYNDRKIKFDAQETPITTRITGTLPSIHLFGQHKIGQITSYKYRIYFAKITHGSTLVRDFIPVRIGTTGYLYDRANPTGGPLGNGLYPNSGTGDFVLGRDVNPISARSYVQDGLIAMWDGIENAGWGQHDASATTWVDLTGNHVLTHESTPVFTANAFVLPGNMKIAYCDSDLFLAAVKNNSVTCEFCFKGYSVGGNNSILSLNRSLKNGSERAWWQWGRVSFSYRLNSGSTWADNTLLPEGELPAATLSFPLTDCYKDGTLVHSGPQPASNSMTGKALQIGMIGSHASTINGYESMRADIHSIRIYSRVLAAAEIATNYAVDVARFNLPQAS